MMKKNIVLFVVWFCALSALSALENGSFENGLTGWTIEDQVGAILTTNVYSDAGFTFLPKDGSQFLLLEAHARITQQIEFPDANTVISGRTGWLEDSSSGAFDMGIIYLYDPDGVEHMVWYKDSYAFTSVDWETWSYNPVEMGFKAGTYTLELYSWDSGGTGHSVMLVDDITVVPEPTTVLTLALGGLVLGLIRRIHFCDN